MMCAFYLSNLCAKPCPNLGKVLTMNVDLYVYFSFLFSFEPSHIDFMQLHQIYHISFVICPGKEECIHGIH